MERKKCNNCGKYLISFQGKYMHPEIPCSGITDAIKISAEVIDKDLQDIFEELYGRPEISDYEMLEKYETELKEFNDIINNKVYQFLKKIKVLP